MTRKFTLPRVYAEKSTTRARRSPRVTLRLAPPSVPSAVIRPGATTWRSTGCRCGTGPPRRRGCRWRVHVLERGPRRCSSRCRRGTSTRTCRACPVRGTRTMTATRWPAAVAAQHDVPTSAAWRVELRQDQRPAGHGHHRHGVPPPPRAALERAVPGRHAANTVGVTAAGPGSSASGHTGITTQRGSAPHRRGRPPRAPRHRPGGAATGTSDPPAAGRRPTSSGS